MAAQGTQASPVDLTMTSQEGANNSTSLPNTPPAAPHPASHPSPNQTKNLLTLPPELLDMIIDSRLLSPIDHHSLRLTHPILHAQPSPHPNLTRTAYIALNTLLENHAPSTRPLLRTTLLCTTCLTFHPSTAFPDRHAFPAYKSPRQCINCHITTGRFDRRHFQLGGVKHFACGSCKRAMPVGREKVVEREAVWKLRRGAGVWRARELRVKVGGKRWCRGCWRGVRGLWAFMEEGAVILEVKDV